MTEGNQLVEDGADYRDATDVADSCHKSLRGSAGQFFVAGELCRRGWVAVVTLGNCPNTDILCSNLRGDRFVHIQVKTFRPGSRTCSVGTKAEIDYGPTFFWVLAGIPSPGSPEPLTYYVIPAKETAKNVRESSELWRDTPGVHGQSHNPENTVRTVALPPRICRNKW